MVLLENQEKSTKTLIKKYFITVYWWRIFINNVWWKQLWKLKKNYVSIFGVSNHQQKYRWKFCQCFSEKIQHDNSFKHNLCKYISFFLSIFNKKNSPPSLFQTSTNLSHHNLPVQHLLQGLSFPPMVRCLVKL